MFNFLKQPPEIRINNLPGKYFLPNNCCKKKYLVIVNKIADTTTQNILTNCSKDQ